MSLSLSVLPERFNFAEHLVSLNAERGDQPAFIDDSQVLSYRELTSSVRRFADALLRLGLKPEQRILVFLNDCVEWPVAFLGAMYAGLVPVPLNTLLPEIDVAYMLEHSGACAAVIGYSLLSTFEKACKLTEQHCECLKIVVASNGDTLPPDGQPFTRLLASGSAERKPSCSHRDGIAFWLYSSGSTGRPKGVVHSHGNLYWTAKLYAKPILGLTPADRVFSAAKLFFAYGLGNALTFPLSAGATAILMAERPTPQSVLARMVKHRPSVFCGAPTLYASLVGAFSGEERAPEGLRLCTSAGEALPRDIGLQFSKRFGAEILDGLGSTEMLHIFVSNRLGEICYGTTGKALEGYEVEVRDEAGACVNDGLIGDLWVKGPSSALLYWNDRAKSNATFYGQWVRTGDKYVRREDGYLVYAGRNDDMLKISGQYVSPFEVESTLMQHPSVFEAGVVGLLDPAGLCKAKAFVVLKPGNVATDSLAEELKAFVKSRIAPFKRPHFVEFVPDLPKTATGKIQRFRLREWASR
jgi:benzoate-CoA ligase